MNSKLLHIDMVHLLHLPTKHIMTYLLMLMLGMIEPKSLI